MTAILHDDHRSRGEALALLCAALCALIAANSPLGAAYHRFWHMSHGLGGWRFTLQAVINDGAMALFFLAIGLELKQELRTGLFRHPRAMALPVIAALAGMVVPALLFVALNPATPARHGWAIPMATDVAFAGAIPVALGRRTHRGVLLLLLALAIVDDLGAIAVIAVYYTRHIHPGALLAVAAGLGSLVAANIRRLHSPVLYGLIGLWLWVAVAQTGLSPPLAGILLAAGIPLSHPLPSKDRPQADHRPAPGARIARRLRPLVSYGVLPLFALANADIPITPRALAAHPGVVAGIFVGLLVGKLIGIGGAAWLLVRTRVAHLPAATSLRDVIGVAWLGGIGFTMALFLNSLSFTDPSLREAGKLGILLASPLAALAGAVWLWRGPLAPSS
ncbi:MAG: Na+/H+ antiporter NhaA [Gammaproteobacteria bacterium]|nr:Na+/H+ antiporter NhaA [Gammaproteobacteria bacterium]